MRIMPGGSLESEQEGPSSVFVGQKLDEHRGAFLLEYPMDKGAVVDGRWDAMEKIWEVSSLIILVRNRFSRIQTADSDATSWNSTRFPASTHRSKSTQRSLQRRLSTQEAIETRLRKFSSKRFDALRCSLPHKEYLVCMPQAEQLELSWMLAKG